ncbi:MAG: TatD family hydrolase [Termitinemataceae bacterium]|nr:MAG: TatD family hydrolase [Termitinemataceae bacterium]
MNKKTINGLIDTHAHLSHLAERGIDVQNYLTNLFANGFGKIIDIGNNSNDLADRVKKLSHFKNIHFAAGIWPYSEAIIDRKKQIEILEKQIIQTGQEKIVAIGECGFDRRENPAAGNGEIELFGMQLDLARSLKKPIIVHTREAALDAVAILKNYQDVIAIIHCFSYGPEDVKKFLDLNCYISFAGNLTFKNAPLLHESIKVVPHDRLLLETDCPYLAPHPYRGQIAHPEMLIETYGKAADMLCIDLEELKEIVRQNTKNAFGIFD